MKSRSWKEVKAEMEQLDLASGRDVDVAREIAHERTRAYVLGHRLSQLRNEIGLTQEQVAQHMGISQPRVSQLENGDLDQMEVETIRRYVAALGGHLKIVADFDDHDVNVSTPEINRQVPA